MSTQRATAVSEVTSLLADGQATSIDPTDYLALILLAQQGSPLAITALQLLEKQKHIANTKQHYIPVMVAAYHEHRNVVAQLLPPLTSRKLIKAKEVLRITESARSIAGDIATIFSKLSYFFAALHPILVVFPWTSIVTLGISSLYTTFMELKYNKEHHIAPRALVSLCALGILGISITLFFLPHLLLPLAAASVTLRAMQFGVKWANALVTELVGEGKQERAALKQLKACMNEHIKHFKDNGDTRHLSALHALHSNITRLRNKQRARRGDIAWQALNIAQCLVALTGTVLLFFPPTVPAGMIILAAVAVYDILDTVGYNPIKMLVNRLFNHPFAPLKEYKTREEFKTALIKEQGLCKKPTTNSTLSKLGKFFGISQKKTPIIMQPLAEPVGGHAKPAFFDAATYAFATPEVSRENGVKLKIS